MARRVRTPHMALARLIAQGIFRAELSELSPTQTMAILRTAHMVALAGFEQIGHGAKIDPINPTRVSDQ